LKDELSQRQYSSNVIAENIINKVGNIK